MAEYKPWENKDQSLEDLVKTTRQTKDIDEGIAAVRGIREKMGNFIRKADSVKISTYVPNKSATEKHEEGDVWEERGKLWTIKNGIKQTVDKMRGAKIPYWCPECGRTMKGRADEKMWWKTGRCHVCVISEETQMRIDGTYKEYEANKIRANMMSWLRDMIETVEGWKEAVANPSTIYLDGRFEEIFDINPDKIKKELGVEIEKLKELLDEWKEIQDETNRNVESV